MMQDKERGVTILECKSYIEKMSISIKQQTVS